MKVVNTPRALLLAPLLVILALLRKLLLKLGNQVLLLQELVEVVVVLVMKL